MHLELYDNHGLGHHFPVSLIISEVRASEHIIIDTGIKDPLVEDLVQGEWVPILSHYEEYDIK